MSAPAPIAGAIEQWRCSPLRVWLTEAACAKNRARAGETGDVMLTECVGCSGVRARRVAGDETEGPRALSAQGLVTAPPVRAVPEPKRRIAVGASVSAQMREQGEKRRAAIAAREEAAESREEERVAEEAIICELRGCKEVLPPYAGTGKRARFCSRYHAKLAREGKAAPRPDAAAKPAAKPITPKGAPRAARPASATPAASRSVAARAVEAIAAVMTAGQVDLDDLVAKLGARRETLTEEIAGIDEAISTLKGAQEALGGAQ